MGVPPAIANEFLSASHFDSVPHSIKMQEIVNDYEHTVLKRQLEKAQIINETFKNNPSEHLAMAQELEKEAYKDHKLLMKLKSLPETVKKIEKSQEFLQNEIEAFKRDKHSTPIIFPQTEFVTAATFVQNEAQDVEIQILETVPNEIQDVKIQIPETVQNETQDVEIQTPETVQNETQDVELENEHQKRIRAAKELEQIRSELALPSILDPIASVPDLFKSFEEKIEGAKTLSELSELKSVTQNPEELKKIEAKISQVEEIETRIIMRKIQKERALVHEIAQKHVELFSEFCKQKHTEEELDRAIVRFREEYLAEANQIKFTDMKVDESEPSNIPTAEVSKEHKNVSQASQTIEIIVQNTKEEDVASSQCLKGKIFQAASTSIQKVVQKNKPTAEVSKVEQLNEISKSQVAKEIAKPINPSFAGTNINTETTAPIQNPTLVKKFAATPIEKKMNLLQRIWQIILSFFAKIHINNASHLLFYRWKQIVLGITTQNRQNSLYP